MKESRQSRVSTNGGQDTNQIVLLETSEGKHVAVDLGPGTRLKDVDIARGTQVSVSGSVISVDGKPVFIADRVQVGDRTTNVNRRAPAGDRRPKVQSFSGTIAEMKEVGIKDTDQKHQIAVLQTDKKDRKLLVDLGPKAETQALELAKGDRATVSGIGMNINDRRVLIAQHVKKGEQSVDVERDSLPDLNKVTKGKARSK